MEETVVLVIEKCVNQRFASIVTAYVVSDLTIENKRIA